MSSDPDPEPGTTALLWGLIAALWLLYALLTAASEAVLALSESKTRKAAEEGDRKAVRLLRFVEEPARLTLQTQTAKAVLLLLIGAALSLRYIPLIKAYLRAFLGTVPAFLAAFFLLACAAVLITLTLFDRLPRRLAAEKAERLAPRLLWILRLMLTLFAPLTALIRLCSRGLQRLCGLDPHADGDAVTEEEILQMVDEGEETGVIEGSQKEMINNIFAFDDITADEIMTPRTDVTALSVDTGIKEALEVSVREGYSRLPLYEEDIDHIEGILYVKDLLPFVGQPIPPQVTLRQLMRDTFFVPGTKRCRELFSAMTATHVHMAVVVDEYGGVAGIVTMEDLVESIVGNIQDEFDNEEEEIVETGENSFSVDGSASMEELCERWDVLPPEGDYDTLAGFIMDELGRIPEKEEHPVVTYRNLTLTVTQMDDRRIEKVHVQVTPAE